MAATTRTIVLLLLPLIYFVYIIQIIHREQQNRYALLSVQARVMASAVEQCRKRLIASESAGEDSLRPGGKPFARVVLNRALHPVFESGPAMPLPSAAFLAAIWRGRTLAEPIVANGQAFWRVGRAFGSVQNPQAELLYFPFFAQVKSALPKGFYLRGLHLGLWINDRLITEAGADSVPVALTLPSALLRRVTKQELTWTGMLESVHQRFYAAAFPVKDFDMWEVTGIFLIYRAAPGRLSFLWRAVTLPSALLGLTTILMTGLFTLKKLK
ncbi:MAG: hypothetical protein D6814_02325 [Calditrichaeota bacterium]|nr:MAG: hypothetical protein D6814_02325 [Calditrichota bacterium]